MGKSKTEYERRSGETIKKWTGRCGEGLYLHLLKAAVKISSDRTNPYAEGKAQELDKLAEKVRGYLNAEA